MALGSHGTGPVPSVAKPDDPWQVQEIVCEGQIPTTLGLLEDDPTMFHLDHAVALVAERERDIREAARARQLPARFSFLTRARKRLAAVLLSMPEPPTPERPSSRSPRVLGRGFEEAVSTVSARACDTHGQGAC